MTTRQSKPKPYTGYRSFQYLEPGVDYQPFRLAREVGRVEPYVVPVSPEQERTVQEILDEELVISLHDHPFVTPEDAAEIVAYNRQGRQWTGYEGLSISRIDVIFDNFMDGTALITSNAGWKWTDIIHDIGMRYSDLAHQEMVFVATTVDDLLHAKREGKIALVPSLEAATPIENELDRVDVLYGLGIRCMGIAYSEANSLGAGLREARDGGLTEFGRQVVRRMNRLGMAIDVSHSGDQTAYDTIEVSEKPIFITHVGARAVEYHAHEAGLGPARLRREGWRDRHRGGAAHDPDRATPRPFHRLLHGAFRVRGEPRRHRPRRLRAGHHVRRPRGHPPRLRPAVVDFPEPSGPAIQ